MQEDAENMTRPQAVLAGGLIDLDEVLKLLGETPAGLAAGMDRGWYPRMAKNWVKDDTTGKWQPWPRWNRMAVIEADLRLRRRAARSKG